MPKEPEGRVDLRLPTPEKNLERTLASRDMVSRVAKFILPGKTQVRIVETDSGQGGASFEDYLSILPRFLRSGVAVRFLLVDGRDESCRKLMISAASAFGKGTFELYRPKSQLQERHTSVIEEWRSAHFVLFENPDMLWVERGHRPHELVSEAASFFPPGTVAEAMQYGYLRKIFDEIVDYGSVRFK
jgi:hypothetical protein